MACNCIKGDVENAFNFYILPSPKDQLVVQDETVWVDEPETYELLLELGDTFSQTFDIVPNSINTFEQELEPGIYTASTENCEVKFIRKVLIDQPLKIKFRKQLAHTLKKAECELDLGPFKEIQAFIDGANAAIDCNENKKAEIFIEQAKELLNQLDEDYCKCK